MDEQTSSNNNSVYILDSYGLIYRAYFALINHPLTNKKGENISAVVIFFRNLISLIKKYKPTYLAAAFDSRTPTFRHEIFKEYKATRQKTPEDLHAQVPWIEDILNAMGIPVLRCDGFEADDIIATVSAKCEAEKRPCRILSADKDLLQLVTDLCKEMQPDKANGGWETEGVQEVISKWGIGPDAILDYLSLVGDSADNVPGVKGVGDKTALKLLGEYKTLDGIYEHSDEIKGAIGNKIREGKDSAYFSKKLIQLRFDVPVSINWDDFSTANLNYAAAGKKLSEYGAFTAAKAMSEMGNGELFDTSDKGSKDYVGHADSDFEDSDNSVPLHKNCGKYTACTKLEDLQNFIDSVLASGKEVAFDTETDSLDTHTANLVGFSLCCKSGEGIYVPVLLAGGMFAPETIAKKDCIEQLSRLLDNPEVLLIMHNGKFDLKVLASNGYTKRPVCRIADTMVAAWLLNPDAMGKTPYSLEYLGQTKLALVGTEFSELVGKGQTFADVPLEQAVDYGAEDADFTWQLWQIFKKNLAEKKLEILFYDMEMKVLPILAAMEIRGIHLDKQALAEYKLYLEEQISAKQTEIYNEVGHEFNIASTKQLQQVLFDERHLVPGKKTKSGYSTDTAVLEELMERTDDPIPKMILEYRSFTKLLSTYVDSLPKLADSESRIHTSFLQTGTATGRLSSRDPNLQNIPVRDNAGRRIRAAFTAEPGTVLISADYSQIELVVLAHLSGDKNLCQSFIDGVDVHRATASLIYGIKPDDVTDQMRRFAKTVNFGVMYGMSAFRLANELGISRTEAKNFIDQYFETYSDVRSFIDQTVNTVRENGYSSTIMGRRRVIRGINSKNKLEQQEAERIAINTPIQGSAADIVKQAMINVNKALASSDSPAHMLLQVHDELIFECPDDEKVINDTIDLIRTNMESAAQLRVPLRVSIEYGKNWGEFH